MPTRRAVLGVIGGALVAGCAGNRGTSDNTETQTSGESTADGATAPSNETLANATGSNETTTAVGNETNATGGNETHNETNFDQPAVETPEPAACSPDPRPPATDGSAYPTHPGDVTELSALRFAQAYETALAKNRVAAETPTAEVVAVEPVDSSLKAPGTDEWYVVSVTIQLTTRTDGEKETSRVGGTYYLTEEVAMRDAGASEVDGDVSGIKGAVVVACP
ncbi:hypothetical protein C499_11009 [Halogeometricum borinquense DSM 11551]|uniref:Lipoprotein n=1 Tax=Halogeometricum borinquense (strain ATCC 700274 / DSM 11551 / JCM 10706 / KCTC 4070 / PR3) TaxID=469382 RepID=E4NS43_HALBP|nr:hypothetical protein [Halogeometricum borinquense]ADQ65728.1 hypothetical protein Hbor_01170 [Halogeometricum borinquense DSM 11551]ELY27057.1 hypothetical protein C499_11009 [Halogeometricum borinquense DSM 11551]